MLNFKNKDSIGKIFYIISIALFILMIYFCFTKNFMWRDEYFSLGIINLYPLQACIEKIASDVHPPLYYFIVKSILYIFNMIHINFDIKVLTKLISVLPYFLFLLISYTKIRKEYNWLTAGLFSFVLVTMSEFFMFYQIMRMYSWAIFFTLMGFLYVKNILEGNDTKSWIMLTLFSLLGAYTHYFCAITSIVLYLFLLGYFILYEEKLKKDKIKKWLLSTLISVILYIPWILTLFNQIKSVHESFWIPDIKLSYIIYCISYILNGSENILIELFSILALITILILVFKSTYKINNKIENYFLICGISTVFLEIIFCIVFSYVYRSLLLVRYFLPAIAIFWVALSMEIGKIDNKRILSVLLIIILLGGMASFVVGCENIDDLHAKNQKEMKKISIMNNSDSSVIYSTNFIYLQFKDTLTESNSYILDVSSNQPEYRDGVNIIDKETYKKLVNENTSNTYFVISDKYDIPESDKETKRVVSIYHREFYKFV